MTEKISQSELLELTTEIVVAHVGNNALDSGELSKFIQDVYATLMSVGTPPEPVEQAKPVVPIKKSVFADYIICLECGKKLKMLKRHLKTAHDQDIEDYRQKWNLPSDYPMVAPKYADHRSTLAKAIGLGTMARRRDGK